MLAACGADGEELVGGGRELGGEGGIGSFGGGEDTS